MDELQERVWQIFQPATARQIDRIRRENTRFVHYTSGESGVAILRSGRMLLRNSTMMNDFSEVQHGTDCLIHAYRSAAGIRLQAAMKDIQEDLPEVFVANFDERLRDFRQETYIVSISEHGDLEHGDELEDAFGRLSMWRAYANRNGIAFVFNNTPFVTDTNALNAFTSPVLYATPHTFIPYFEEIVAGIENNIEFLRGLGGQFFHEMLMHTFRFIVQSTKHPSFREEREWRVIYSPTLLQREGEVTEDQIAKIPTEIMVLNGVPQRVYAIPFKNYEEEGFVGATIPELIERVLIGPSIDAYPIAQAFIGELMKHGVDNAVNKVVLTGVPLRV